MTTGGTPPATGGRSWKFWGRAPAEQGALSVVHSGPAIASAPGAVANSGILVINAPPEPAAQSAYLHDVRRIAPEYLTGREAELAELAAFCCSGDGSNEPYAWWRGPAWAGKSALMASFVLHPPEGVRVVSFFITARFFGHSDRAAFVEIVVEQLAEVLGQPVPRLTDANQSGLFLKMLTEAAELCRSRGERLILLVDGLDEDRGVQHGWQRYSIAGLLPARPPAGMRIVLAGRLNPPIPGDVLDDHPLRNPRIVRELDRSPAATAVRTDAERDLRNLLRGTQSEQDLLGLVTAAGGGLSGADLAELTGQDAWQVDEYLHTVAGRSFARRAGRWTPETEMYVLGHEELQHEAERLFGTARLAGYRSRLHTWADQYRDAGWPAETPEYLLRGYYRLLRSTGDSERVVACGTDTVRHNRMLDLTGGDTAGLGEIRIAMDLLRREPRSDLLRLLRLAMHRSELRLRNTNVPPRLPSTWAALGRHVRARSLASAITSPAERAAALATVAAARPAGGPEAEALLDEAEQAARSVEHVGIRSQALARVASSARQAGFADRTDRLLEEATITARSVTDSDKRATWLAKLAAEATPSKLAATLLSEAETLATSVTDRYGINRMIALTDVAIAWFTSGHASRGSAPLQLAEETLDTVHERFRAPSLSALSQAYSAARQVERAETMLDEISDPSHRDRATAALIETVAESDAERVQQLLARLQMPYSQAASLAVLAEARLRRGDDAAAIQLAEASEELARQIDHDPRLARNIAELAAVVGTVLGERPRAHQLSSIALQLTAAIKDPASINWVSSALAAAFAAAGDATNAERCARMATDNHSEDAGLRAVAETMAAIGSHERAEAAAHEIVYDHERTDAFSSLFRAALASRQIERASRLALAIPDTAQRVAALASIAPAQLVADNAAGAKEMLAAAMKVQHQSSYDEALALSAIAEAVALTDRAQALELCATAEHHARQLDSHPDLQDRALIAVSSALAKAGDLNRATVVSRTISEQAKRAAGLARLCRIAHMQGGMDKEAALATEAEQLIEKFQDEKNASTALSELAHARAASGRWSDAERLADRVSGPVTRAETFSSLAVLAVESGQPDTARRLTAEALVSGTPWSKTLTAIARLEPDTLNRIADEISAYHPHPGS